MMIKLREFHRQDLSSLVLHLNNPAVNAFLSTRLPHPYTEEDGVYWIECGQKEGGLSYAIEFNNSFCGAVGVYFRKGESEAEIGYWLGECFWGKGIASKAVDQLCRIIFETTDIQRIYNPVTELNVRSIKVMEKSGFIKSKILKNSVSYKGESVDEWLYEKIKVAP